MEPVYGKNNKEERPLAHYLERYRAADPGEMSVRCGLPWDDKTRQFSLTFLGEQFTLTHPEFVVEGPRTLTNAERILLLRYLLEGRAAPAGGRWLTYREVPWGEVYLQQFDGRCVKRFAFTYGGRPELLERIVARLPAVRLDRGDAGYQVELLPGLQIQFILWLGDEEFPPSGQILFSDNFLLAFTAEDMAVIGDIVLGRMKALAAEEEKLL